MIVEFEALIKEVKAKALASLDKGYEIKIQGENENMFKLAQAPADATVTVRVEWDDGTSESGNS